MKVRIATDGELPGGLFIEAETPEEGLYLRIFASWPHSTRSDVVLEVNGNDGSPSPQSQTLLINWVSHTMDNEVFRAMCKDPGAKA